MDKKIVFRLMLFALGWMVISVVNPCHTFISGAYGAKQSMGDDRKRSERFVYSSAFKSMGWAFCNDYVEFAFSDKSLALTKIINKKLKDNYLKGEGISPFAVEVGKKNYSAAEFVLIDRKMSEEKGIKKLQLLGECKQGDVNLLAILDITIENNNESTWKLTLRNFGSKEEKLNIYFPLLNGFRIGNNWDNNIAFIPISTGIICSLPKLKNWLGTLALEPQLYNGAMNLQMLNLYEKELKEGFYIIVKDSKELLRKSFNIVPLPDERTCKIVFLFGNIILKPSGSFSTPAVAMALYPGDWHNAIDAYRRWLLSWMKPLEPPNWWLEREGHGLFGNPYVFCPAKEYDRLLPYYFLTAKEINPNYLCIYHWRDYAYKNSRIEEWEDLYIPDKEPLKRAIERIHQLGGKVMFYVEGLIWDDRTKEGQKHYKEWVIRDSNNNPVGGGGMCPGAVDWQKHLSDKVVAKTMHDVNVDAFYIDSIGAKLDTLCYNLKHGHSEICCWNRGTLQLLERLYRSIINNNPEGLLFTEQVGADVHLKYGAGGHSTFFRHYSFWNNLRNQAEMTNVLKYLFPHIAMEDWLFQFWGYFNDLPNTPEQKLPIDDRPNFANQLLSNLACHMNAIYPTNLWTPTTRKAVEIRRDNLDAINFGLIDYDPVVSPEYLYCHGFKGKRGYFIAVLNPENKDSEYVLELPISSLPWKIKDRKRLSVYEQWRMKELKNWEVKDEKIIIKDTIGNFDYEKLKNIPAYYNVGRHLNAYIRYKGPNLDNFRAYVIIPRVVALKAKEKTFYKIGEEIKYKLEVLRKDLVPPLPFELWVLIRDKSGKIYQKDKLAIMDLNKPILVPLKCPEGNFIVELKLFKDKKMFYISSQEIRVEKNRVNVRFYLPSKIDKEGNIAVNVKISSETKFFGATCDLIIPDSFSYLDKRKILIFNEKRFSSFAPPGLTPEKIAEIAQKFGYETSFINAQDLDKIYKFSPLKYPTLILPYGEVIPRSGYFSLYLDFLSKGGNIINLGGYAFKKWAGYDFLYTKWSITESCHPMVEGGIWLRPTDFSLDKDDFTPGVEHIYLNDDLKFSRILFIGLKMKESPTGDGEDPFLNPSLLVYPLNFIKEYGEQQNPPNPGWDPHVIMNVSERYADDWKKYMEPNYIERYADFSLKINNNLIKKVLDASLREKELGDKPQSFNIYWKIKSPKRPGIYKLIFRLYWLKEKDEHSFKFEIKPSGEILLLE